MRQKCYYMIELGLGLLDKSDKSFYCTYRGNCNSKINCYKQDKCLYEILKNGDALNERVKSKLERVGE